MPKLFVKTGEKKGFVFRLGQDAATIGRDATNKLILPDRRISRNHAKVTCENETWSIEDAGSVNGTFVNQTIVQKHLLEYGDEILLGSTLLQFLPLNANEDLTSTKAESQVKLIEEEESSASFVELSLSSDQVSDFSAQKRDDLEQSHEMYERLNILYHISNELGRFITSKEIFERILESCLSVVNADRGFIMLWDEEVNDLVLQAVYKRESLHEQEEISLSRTIADKVMKSGESVLVKDVLSDSNFKEAQSIILQRIRSTMCVPLKAKDKILGILYVDTKGKVVRFTKNDLEMLSAIASQSAVALQNAQLFDGLRRANQELKQQQEQLIEAEKLSALGKLAGGVAHEINNPMTSILGYSQLAVQQLNQGNLSQEQLAECIEFITIVESEAQRCQSMVKTLLEFGRRKKEAMTAADINQPIEAALMVARFHIGKTNIEICKELTDGLPQVLCNTNQLQQVFLNLIVNARDAMESGGKLSISSRMDSDGWIEVKFSDTGCGIPEEKLDEIFKPLFTTKEEGKGTGLGLSITQDIIDRHKGKIEVESRSGQGTTFTLRFPVKK